MAEKKQNLVRKVANCIKDDADIIVYYVSTRDSAKTFQ